MSNKTPSMRHHRFAAQQPIDRADMFSRQDGRLYAAFSIMTLAIAAVLPVLARAAYNGDAQSGQTAAAPDNAGPKKSYATSVTRFSGVTVNRKRSQTGAAVATKQTQDRVMDVVTKEQIET